MNSIIVHPLTVVAEGKTITLSKGTLVNVGTSKAGNFVIESKGNKAIEIPFKLREAFVQSVASLSEFASKATYKDYSLVEALSMGADVRALTNAAYDKLHVQSKKFEGKYGLRVLERSKTLTTEAFSKEVKAEKAGEVQATSVTSTVSEGKDILFSVIKSQLTGVKVESSKEFVEFVGVTKEVAESMKSAIDGKADTYVRESKLIVRKNGFTETDMQSTLLAAGFFEMEDEDCCMPTHDTQQQANADAGSDDASDERNDAKKDALGQKGDTDDNSDYKSESDDDEDDADDKDGDDDKSSKTEDDEQNKVTNSPDGTDDPMDNNSNDGETNDVKVAEMVLKTMTKANRK